MHARDLLEQTANSLLCPDNTTACAGATLGFLVLLGIIALIVRCSRHKRRFGAPPGPGAKSHRHTVRSTSATARLCATLRSGTLAGCALAINCLLSVLLYLALLVQPQVTHLCCPVHHCGPHKPSLLSTSHDSCTQCRPALCYPANCVNNPLTCSLMPLPQ